MSIQLSKQLAKHFREVYFGKNWTSTDCKTALDGLTLAEVTRTVYGLNTIATLVNHINYYVAVQKKVLEGGPLEGNDKLSFEHPPFNSEEEWKAFLDQVHDQAEAFAKLVEQIPDEDLSEDFGGEKYGSTYRNIQGMIEHVHYHLGQIVIIRKILNQKN